MVKKESRNDVGLYGCNTNHPEWKPAKDGYWIQDGWTEMKVMCEAVDGLALPVKTRIPVMKYIKDRMSRGCDYDRCDVDSYCEGCTMKNSLRKYDGK